MGQRLQIVAGGATRADSVANALARLDPACRIVLVHDAARPFVSDETIDAVIAAAQAGTGAVAAVPVGDTLKQVAGSPDSNRLTVRATVDRRDLWRAQTPQGFPRALLEAAYADWGSVADVTDDAQLVERAGGTVVLIPDHTTNIKVTTAQDFALAEALASR